MNFKFILAISISVYSYLENKIENKVPLGVVKNKTSVTASNLSYKFEIFPVERKVLRDQAQRVESAGIGSGYAAIGPKESDEYLCASTYTLQSHDNPPMIYAVNFLRDVASLALQAAPNPGRHATAVAFTKA